MNYHIRERIQRQGILPAIYAENAEQAIGVANALSRENFYVVDFPWKGDVTGEILIELSQRVPGIQYGCSLLTTADQVKQAERYGAQFGFISVINQQAMEAAVESELFVFPMASTLGEVDIAVEKGFTYICLAPITLIGGPDFIYQLKRMYPHIHFLPRGEIATSTAEDYLSFSNVFACEGDWLAPIDLIKNNDWDAIRLNAREAVYAMLGFQIDNIEIKSDLNQIGEISELFDVFNLHVSMEEGMCRVGKEIVFSKDADSFSTSIIITISTNHIKRSVTYLQSKGYSFKMNEAPIDTNGRYPYVYLKHSAGGVEIKLLQKNSRTNQ